MPFLPPNQQRQSTEGTKGRKEENLNKENCGSKQFTSMCCWKWSKRDPLLQTSPVLWSVNWTYGWTVQMLAEPTSSQSWNSCKLKDHVLNGVHNGTTWRIRMNDPHAAAMPPCVKLFQPLVITFWQCKILKDSTLPKQPNQSSRSQ